MINNILNWTIMEKHFNQTEDSMSPDNDQKLVSHSISNDQPRDSHADLSDIPGIEDNSDASETEHNENLIITNNNLKTATMNAAEDKDFGETPITNETPYVNKSTESVEQAPLEESYTSNDEPKILRVRADQLKPNPVKKKIYTNQDLDDLLISLRENGNIIHTPLLVTKDMVIVDGERKYEAGKLCGIEEFDVVVIEVDESDIAITMIESNIHRIKTGDELFNEIQILKEYYGNRQGMRDTLITSTDFGGSEKRKEDAQAKISKLLNVSKGTMTQLKEIHAYNPEYLKQIDNRKVKTNMIYSKVIQEKNEKVEKERLEKLRDKTYDFSKPILFNTSSENMMAHVAPESVDEIITSIPFYHLIHYAEDEMPEIGWEKTVDEYLESLQPIFKNCFKVLKKSGSFFLNIGDSRDEFGLELNIPHRILEQLKVIGFKYAQTIIWEKRNHRSNGDQNLYAPSFEYIFHVVKSTEFKTKRLQKSNIKNVIHDEALDTSESYLTYKGQKLDEFWISNDFVRTPLKQQEVEGEIVDGFKHPCPFNAVIPVPLILDFTDEGDTVLDPFSEIGTIGLIALDYSRKFIGFETNETYHKVARERLNQKINELGVKFKSKPKNEELSKAEFLDILDMT